MPSAEIAVQVNDLEFGSFLERIESSNFSDPEEDLASQYFPDRVPLVARALLIDLQIHVEVELIKVLKTPGFEKIKYCYTLVSFGSKRETLSV
jgi:hypothetical protein